MNLELSDHGTARIAATSTWGVTPFELLARTTGTSMRGLTLFELIAAIALTTVVAATAAAGAASLRRSVSVESAAAQLASVLRDARLRAYRSQRTVSVSAAQGSTTIRIFDATTESTVSLPAPIRVVQATRSGVVRFYPSGLSDNASWVLAPATHESGSARRVVVNQRSVIRCE